MNRRTFLTKCALAASAGTAYVTGLAQGGKVGLEYVWPFLTRQTPEGPMAVPNRAWRDAPYEMAVYMSMDRKFYRPVIYARARPELLEGIEGTRINDCYPFRFREKS